MFFALRVSQVSMPLTATVILMSVLTQEVKTFQDKDFDLVFQHPASWTVKKAKYSTDMSFAVSDGSVATVQLFKTQFRQDRSDWMRLQREVADQLKRQVSRQWEEQILGVPLLLTRLHYFEGESEQSTLVGMLYAATSEKMTFRLTSTVGTEQETEKAWRDALYTLRTMSGNMPVPEDPTKPPVNPNKTLGGKAIMRLSPDGDGTIVRSKNVQQISRLGLKLNVYLPDGWTIEATEDTAELKIEKLMGAVSVSFTTGARAQVPDALADANRASFERFKYVTLRDDAVPGLKKSGSYVASTLRIGPSKQDGVAVEWHIVGTSGTVLWRIIYTAGSEEAYKADRKLIEKLIDVAAVETAQ